MSKPFLARYEIDDGYAGVRRQHYFDIDASCIEDDMTAEELLSLFNERLEEDFVERLIPMGVNEDEFIEWAKAIISARRT